MELKESRTREVIESGGLAGFFGGVAMVVVAVIYNLAIGANPLAPIAAITATLRGSAVLDISAGTVIVGAFVHLFVASLWGVVFASGMPRNVAPAPAIAFGTFAGVAVLVVMSWIVVPLVNPVTRAHLLWGSSPGSLPVSIAFLMHILYGASLAVVPWLERRVHNASFPHAPSKGSPSSHFAR